MYSLPHGWLGWLESPKRSMKKASTVMVDSGFTCESPRVVSAAGHVKGQLMLSEHLDMQLDDVVG